MKTRASSGVEEREAWRARILRALAELRSEEQVSGVAPSPKADDDRAKRDA